MDTLSDQIVGSICVATVVAFSSVSACVGPPGTEKKNSNGGPSYGGKKKHSQGPVFPNTGHLALMVGGPQLFCWACRPQQGDNGQLQVAAAGSRPPRLPGSSPLAVAVSDSLSGWPADGHPVGLNFWNRFVHPLW